MSPDRSQGRATHSSSGFLLQKEPKKPGTFDEAAYSPPSILTAEKAKQSAASFTTLDPPVCKKGLFAE